MIWKKEFVCNSIFLLMFKNTVSFIEGDLISLREAILQTRDLFGPLFCVSILKIWKTQILCRSSQNFRKLKRVDVVLYGGPILQNNWIICHPLLYFNYKNLKDTNSLSFILFQCVLHDAPVLASVFKSFSKLNKGDLFSVENQFCRITEVFDYNFFISKDPNSFSFLIFQNILHDLEVFFSVF